MPIAPKAHRNQDEGPMADALSPRSRDRSGERGSYSISSGVGGAPGDDAAAGRSGEPARVRSAASAKV